MSERLTLTPGLRLASTTSGTEVIVVQVSDPDAVVECGGQPMVAASGASPCAPGANPPEGGALIGKRYGGPTAPVEVLCVKAGAGTLTANGVVLDQRVAKALPASD